MNTQWTQFLTELGARFSNQTPPALHFPSTPAKKTKQLYPVTHLSSLSVTGSDAATFLQGQLTCDINQIQDKKAGFAAFCNAKGRVISPLLIIRNQQEYILILPQSLAEKVIKKLSMYVLRSDVQITDSTEQLCLSGVFIQLQDDHLPALPQNQYNVLTNDGISFVKLPGIDNRFLAIGQPQESMAFWQHFIKNLDFTPANSDLWHFQDISAGIPWFEEQQSEQYIPQMLNIDKLEGISFNKGCYTGQEIVARTHYLGKNKREMFLAESGQTAMLNSQSAIIDSHTQEKIAPILTYQYAQNCYRLLIVMPPEYKNNNHLAVFTDGQVFKINIIPFQ